MHQARAQRRALAVAIAVGGLLALAAAPAQALVSPTVTVDGPSSAIVDFGGVAMASDGTGGLVYVKAVEGVPHVFASRYLGGGWGPPIRVDWDQPYAASQPQIAAGRRGELLTVWATQVATVRGKVQYGLYSAKIGAGGADFGHSLLVDPNVGEGIGVDPSLSSTSPGKAVVAYRAITFNFNQNVFSTAVQLRPGDVMADIRIARLSGDRWSRLGAINRNPEASMRPPAAANGPQVGTGADGGAVVAWQEPDQAGTARIWMRRIFGTTPGPVLQASPSSWEGRPVTADADALSLSVTPYVQARVAFRLAAGGGSALANRLLVNSLPPNFSPTAGTLSGPQLADGGGAASPGEIGLPSLAAGEDRSRKASMRLAFLAGSQLRQMGIGPDGGLAGVEMPPGPSALAGPGPVVAVDPEGGGLVAYPALDAAGLPAVAVRQEFPSGAAQTGLLSGVQGGPVSELEIGGSGAGDGLIAFRQGEAGHFEIVAERVSSPPAPFSVKAPKGWSKPAAVKLRWQAAPSAVGGLTYSVLVDGRPLKSDLRRRVFHPRPGLLGNGVLRVQVLATDGLGQQLLSKAARLRVDGQRPVVAVRALSGHRLAVRIEDGGSGVAAKATTVSFGDGERARRGTRFLHSYQRSGLYAIAVRAGDRAGNRTWRHFRVRVG